jgi:hypothetical protein
MTRLQYSIIERRTAEELRSWESNGRGQVEDIDIDMEGLRMRARACVWCLFVCVCEGGLVIIYRYRSHFVEISIGTF